MQIIYYMGNEKSIIYQVGIADRYNTKSLTDKIYNKIIIVYNRRMKLILKQ